MASASLPPPPPLPPAPSGIGSSISGKTPRPDMILCGSGIRGTAFSSLPEDPLGSSSWNPEV